MYHRVRRKMKNIIFGAILLLSSQSLAVPRALDIPQEFPDELDNNIIDFDDEYSVKYDKKWQGNNFNKDSYKYSVTKDEIKNLADNNNSLYNKQSSHNKPNVADKTHTLTVEVKTTPEAEKTTELTVIPLELLSTTENALARLVESTAEPDLTVIPLTTTEKVVLNVVINQTVTLPTSTQLSEDTTVTTETVETTIKDLTTQVITKSNITDESVTEQPVTEVDGNVTSTEVNTEQDYLTEKYLDVIGNKNDTTKNNSENTNATEVIANFNNHDQITTDDSIVAITEDYPVTITESTNVTEVIANYKNHDQIPTDDSIAAITEDYPVTTTESTNATEVIANFKNHDQIRTDDSIAAITEDYPVTTTDVITANDTIKYNSNSSEVVEIEKRDKIIESNEDIPIYTELDVEDSSDVPEDYYDSKDLVPTTAPKTDALSVIFGFAGSVVESVVETVAERVVPKGIVDLFKRMQKQNEALEAEKLRSREENGGLGQFTRGIIKTISSGIGKPLSQLMAGVRDYGSLDSDRGFLNSLASGVTSVANAAYSMADAFKDRVQTIYPGTVWCGGGHSAQARSSDLGLFFFTDTCCRQHDACKLYIASGETKYGLTNTGLFTRSHCSCDQKFRECLRRTSSLVSAQIGLTYFNVLGPQCFRRAHPIVRCVRRTRLTGQKCEEYELDYTKPKMWQWFDNETF